MCLRTCYILTGILKFSLRESEYWTAWPYFFVYSMWSMWSTPFTYNSNLTLCIPWATVFKCWFCFLCRLRLQRRLCWGCSVNHANMFPNIQSRFYLIFEIVLSLILPGLCFLWFCWKCLHFATLKSITVNP